MNAIVSCKEHDHSRRSIYDLCETNEGGEVSFPNSLPIYSLASRDIIQNRITHHKPIFPSFSTTLFRASLFTRRPFRSTSSLTNRHKSDKLTDCYEKPDGSTPFSTPGPNPALLPQPPPHPNLDLPQVRNVTNAVRNIRPLFTPHKPQNRSCATNVTGI
jgi:hypothetical protein